MHEPTRTRPTAILAMAVVLIASLGAAADPAPPADCTTPGCALATAPDAPQDTVLELLAAAQAALAKAVADLQAEGNAQLDAAKAAAMERVEAAKRAVEEAQKAVEAKKAEAEAAARAKAREALLAPPERIWTSLNDGAASGLDADALDGLDSGFFLGRIADEAAARQAGDAAEAAARSAADDAERAARTEADDAVRAGVPDAAWATVLARDGGGSGLDADRIDGVDSSQLLRNDQSGRIAGNLAVDGGLNARYADIANLGADSGNFGGIVVGRSTGAKVSLQGPTDRTLDLVSADGSKIWDVYANNDGNLYLVRLHWGLNALFGFRPDGWAIAEGGWGTGGVDFAEYFRQATPGELQARDLACLAGHAMVRKCRDGEAPVGIVSARPGFVGGASLKEPKEGDAAYALVGVTGQLEFRLTQDAKTGDILAPDTYAKIIALEDGKAGEVRLVLVR